MALIPQQTLITSLIKDILGDTYTHLRVKRVRIEEDLEKQTTTVTCDANDEISGEQFAITNTGVGVIDAFFNAMVDRFAAEYPSLQTIRFNSFAVAAQLDTKQQAAGTDAMGEVTLEIATSDDKIFTFTHASRSVIGSALITTLLGLEYFINSERAFVTTYHALKDARERNRQDLIQRYTGTMAQLVQNTSYSEVISKIREELG